MMGFVVLLYLSLYCARQRLIELCLCNAPNRVGILLLLSAIDLLSLMSPIAQSVAQSQTRKMVDSPVYHVREWCSIPSHLDDTCFSNALADIAANGKDQFANHKYAELLVSPEVYTFRKTVVLPHGLNIGIHGAVETGVFGSTIETGLLSSGAPGAVDDFLVLSDSVDFKNLSFVQTSDTKRQAIQLGTDKVTVYDSHINWCWFAGQSIAIHAVNASGLDLSHTTFDQGTEFGILSNVEQGDVQANAIQADDLRGYGNRSSVSISGDGSSHFADISLSGIFDRSTGDSATISLHKVNSVRLQGTFAENNHYDIEMQGVHNVIIGPFVSRDNRYASMRIADSGSVSIANGSLFRAATASVVGPSDIEVKASVATMVHGVSSDGPSAPLRCDLTIDAKSVGSILYGNSLRRDCVLDRTAVFSTHGLQVSGSLKNGSGLQHTRTAIGCKTSAQPFSTCTSAPLAWQIPFADTLYTTTCTLEATQGVAVVSSVAKEPDRYTLTIVNLAPGAATGIADCIAIHD